MVAEVRRLDFWCPRYREAARMSDQLTMSHGVFSKFAYYDGWAEPGFERGFYGVNIRDWLLLGHSKGFHDRRAVDIEHPPVNEEYFEWIALLATIVAAQGRLCRAEARAGVGRRIV